MKVSIVIPAFNEEKVIAATIKAYQDFLTKKDMNFEIIVVNDGSGDSTEKIIHQFKDVICVSYNKNRGKGYAVKRGVLRATGDYIFFTDADLSYAPENILRALFLFDKKAFSGVVGIRENLRRDYPFLRRIMSRAFATFVRLALPTDIPDTQCGFKGFDKETGREIFSRLQTFDFSFDFEVIYLSRILGKPLAGLPVSFVHRSETRVRPVRDFFKAVKSMIFIKRRKTNEAVKV
ncbi:MAG: glycosyltransferase [Clostridia bacterium]|nr:glycosyltransferase [Clostridia bacterium]MBQ9737768.1 glycosyltransferase [Clostridia bacterium]